MSETIRTETNRPVVVGYDGTDRTLAALRYAVAEAGKRRAPLRVVHVEPDFGAAYRGFPEVEAEIRTVAGEVARAVAAEVAAADVAPAVELVETAGSVAEQIVRHADDAQLVVLGHETKTPVERLVTGATTGNVARSSPVPAVVVPDDWRADASSRGVVAVGLRDPGHADALLGVAFAAAAARGSSLRVVHAWALPNPYADAVELRTHGPVWDEAARTMAAGVLEEWRRAYPMVPVTVEVVHDDPAQALVKASADADLLVVLRRKLPVLGPHLGRVGRAVLRSAACPVAVVPADEMLGLAAVEKAGTMLR